MQCAPVISAIRVHVTVAVNGRDGRGERERERPAGDSTSSEWAGWANGNIYCMQNANAYPESEHEREHQAALRGEMVCCGDCGPLTKSS